MTIVGIVLLAIAANENPEKVWRPMTRPYPGVGFKIKDSFKITQDAKYQLEIDIPEHLSDRVSEPDKPSLECVLYIKITTNSVTCVEDTVKQFTHEGEMRYKLMECYRSEQNWHLKSGEYEIEISSEKTPELVTTHGALLNLENAGNPVIGIPLLVLRAGAIWVFCILGPLGLALSIAYDAFKSIRKSPRAGREVAGE